MSRVNSAGAIRDVDALSATPRKPAVQARRGRWMQTATGKQFWPLDPRPEEIDIRDIAHGLAMQCRYGGQCLRFYSVAEHCVLMARYAPDDIKLDTLMHDASEAYLSDVIRPIKAYLTNYREIETELERVIAQRFGLRWPMHGAIKRLDTAILVDERDQVMAPPPVPWSDITEPGLGVTLQFWTPEKAKAEFLAAFYQYGGY